EFGAERLEALLPNPTGPAGTGASYQARATAPALPVAVTRQGKLPRPRCLSRSRTLRSPFGSYGCLSYSLRCAWTYLYQALAPCAPRPTERTQHFRDLSSPRFPKSEM